MVIMDTECSRCAGSGTIGVGCSNLNYLAPGPVPEDARGVAEAQCDRCQGSGVVVVDCETGDEA